EPSGGVLRVPEPGSGQGGGPPASDAGGWRGVIEEYRSRLPVGAQVHVVTLREGGTPLLFAHDLSRRTGCEVYLKLEGLNPTGSFKDRGMTVAITQAVAGGSQAV